MLVCFVPLQDRKNLRLLSATRGSRKSAVDTLSRKREVRPAIISYPDANVTNVLQDDRPYFVLHIGPPKSATTTLQTELTNYNEVLQRDNYAYLGQLMHDPESIYRHQHGLLLNALKDRDCQVAVNQARVNREPWPECWQPFLRTLWKRRQEGRSVILSEEMLSIKYTEMEGLGRTSVDWPSLKMALEGQGWKPVILIGYRRLYDIMPSAKQQWDRWTKVNRELSLWPPNGRALKPLFPDVLYDPRLYDDYVPQHIHKTVQWSYTDHLVEMISPHFPVRLLNIHDTLSIRSTFLCRVLPHAPNSCRQSQIDDATYGELHRNSEESLFYDAIATEAAARGWFDSSLFDRHVVAVALLDYFEEERKGNPMDLPLQCPEAAELELLLERSLVKEQQILSPPVAETMREEHVAGFWKAVDKNKFCWIDVDKTLEDRHWRRFFSEIVPAEEYEQDQSYDTQRTRHE